MISNRVLTRFKEVIVKRTEIVEDKYCFYVEMPVKEQEFVHCGASISKVHDFRIKK
ncbi:hypothetical protein MHI39_03665 [Heyndrickxia sp. FSL K6-6286]|uniref:hypothetical protein n=1 Tax=Heyndrickxia sp. FSL K6-6286 TaxID=2921510 RepID=UPI00315AAC69